MTKKQKIIANGQDSKVNNNFCLLHFIMIPIHLIAYLTKFEIFPFLFWWFMVRKIKFWRNHSVLKLWSLCATCINLLKRRVKNSKKLRTDFTSYTKFKSQKKIQEKWTFNKSLFISSMVAILCMLELKIIK